MGDNHCMQMGRDSVCMEKIWRLHIFYEKQKRMPCCRLVRGTVEKIVAKEGVHVLVLQVGRYNQSWQERSQDGEVSEL